MLSESVHSVADTANELLLMKGRRQARRRPDPAHQFGYGRSRYLYSFVVAVVFFAMGVIFALYEGWHKTHPEPRPHRRLLSQSSSWRPCWTVIACEPRGPNRSG